MVSDNFMCFRKARDQGKIERHPFLDEDEVDVRPPIEVVDIPLELRCKICGDLMRDAVLIPCCGFSFCDDCIRMKLLGECALSFLFFWNYVRD